MTQEVKSAKTAEKPKLDFKKERDKDREIVKGLFKYYEQPGSFLKFNFRKYKQDQIEEYILWDNQVYSLPLGVAKHLNTNGWYPEYSYMKDDSSVKIGMNPSLGNVMRISSKIRRFGFQSLEFTDIEGLPQVSHASEVVRVEPVL